MASATDKAGRALGYRVETYPLTFKSGHSKIATRVIAPNGWVLAFVDKISKERALHNALLHQPTNQFPWKAP